jgi:hypothetical protein
MQRGNGGRHDLPHQSHCCLGAWRSLQPIRWRVHCGHRLGTVASDDRADTGMVEGEHMNKHQQIALAHHCRLAVECVHPQFAYKQGTHSIVLTVNSGYE